MHFLTITLLLLLRLKYLIPGLTDITVIATSIYLVTCLSILSKSAKNLYIANYIQPESFPRNKKSYVSKKIV